MGLVSPAMGQPSRFKAFLVDVDGVLVKGGEPIPGAREALSELKRMGDVVILTNNSTRSRARTAELLQALRFPIEPEEVVTSSYIAARWLLERAGPSRVWIIGEEGLSEELKLAGHTLVPPQEAEWIVVGMDRTLTYAKLADALRALLSGARLLATNRDRTFPTPEGLLPGAGATVGAIEGMGFSPEAVVGKPSPTAFEIALRVAGAAPEETIMIGDRWETDIQGAKRAGLATALVLSGVSSATELSHLDPPPDLVAEDIGRLVKLLTERAR